MIPTRGYSNKNASLPATINPISSQDDTRPSHHIAGRQRASGLQPGHQASARVSHAAGDIASVPSRRLRYALARATRKADTLATTIFGGRLAE
jgi:hypothetical protein